MAMVELSDENFEAEVQQAGMPVLVDFSAEWCGPCKMLEPVLDELSQEYEGKVKFCHVDVDKSRNTAMRFRITSVPTMIFFKDGNQAGALQGVQPKQKLTTELDNMLA